MARTTEVPNTDSSAELDRETYTAPRLDDLGSLADLTQGGGGDEADGADFIGTSTGPT